MWRYLEDSEIIINILLSIKKKMFLKFQKIQEIYEI